MIKYKNKFSDPFGLVLEHIARNTQMMFLGQKKIWQNTEDKMFPIVCHTPCSLYPRVYVCTSVCLLLDVELRLCCSLVQLFRVIRYSNTELNEFRLAGHIQKTFRCPRMLSQFVFVSALAFPVFLKDLMRWRNKTSVTKSWSSWSRTAEVYLRAAQMERPAQKNIPPS